MNQNNDDQKDFWSGPSGTSWIDHEAEQDALLAAVAEYVMSRSGLQPGDRVMDIGCGTGALSELAAQAVGPMGKVLATDISDPLLTRAEERLRTYPQASVQLGDVAIADWTDADFDGAISRFGVMFFSDPPAAFRNIANALRSGGRMTFAAWGPVSANPYWSIGSRTATRRLGPLPGSAPNAPGPMGLADESYAADVLTAAGLTDVRVEPTEVPLVYPKSVDELTALMLKVGPARRFINAHQATPEDIAGLRADLAEALLQFEQPDGTVVLPACLNVITARRG